MKCFNIHCLDNYKTGVTKTTVTSKLTVRGHEILTHTVSMLDLSGNHVGSSIMLSYMSAWGFIESCVILYSCVKYCYVMLYKFLKISYLIFMEE